MSVYGTDTLPSTFRSFSRQCSHSEFSRLAPGYLTPLRLMCHGFAYDTPYGIRPTYSAVGSPDLLRPSITQARWYRNINLSSIDYAFRPRLRSRLTLGGRTFPRKPYPYGGMDFNHTYRYSCLDSHFQKLQIRFRSPFYVVGTLSYHYF